MSTVVEHTITHLVINQCSRSIEQMKRYKVWGSPKLLEVRLREMWMFVPKCVANHCPTSWWRWRKSQGITSHKTLSSGDHEYLLTWQFIPFSMRYASLNQSNWPTNKQTSPYPSNKPLRTKNLSNAATYTHDLKRTHYHHHTHEQFFPWLIISLYCARQRREHTHTHIPTITHQPLLLPTHVFQGYYSLNPLTTWRVSNSIWYHF